MLKARHRAIAAANAVKHGASAITAHASVAHNKSLNGASVILSPFIGVELTNWKVLTLPQVTAVLDPRSLRVTHRNGRKGGTRMSDYWSHRRSGAQIVSNLTSAERRLKLF